MRRMKRRMMRKQIFQKPQKSQNSYMMTREGKVDIRKLYKYMRKRKRGSGSGDELPVKIVRGPRGHRGTKGRRGRKGKPGKTAISQDQDRSVEANVTL